MNFYITSASMTTKHSKDNYILLVEDNEDDIALTRRALEKTDFKSNVVVAHDGQEAIDFLLEKEADAESNLPIVMLLDLNMPKIGGLEVLRRLRSDERTKNLPIVVLTIFDEQNDISESYNLGANSYIQKPLDMNEFFVAIQDLQSYWMKHNTPPPTYV